MSHAIALRVILGPRETGIFRNRTLRVSARKSPKAAHRALRGDLARATLAAIRDAPGPMTTKELARHVIAERRGLNSADTALPQLFTRRTGALLRHQKKRRIVRSVKDPHHGRFDLWEIAVYGRTSRPCAKSRKQAYAICRPTFVDSCRAEQQDAFMWTAYRHVVANGGPCTCHPSRCVCYIIPHLSPFRRVIR